MAGRTSPGCIPTAKPMETWPGRPLWKKTMGTENRQPHGYGGGEVQAAP